LCSENGVYLRTDGRTEDALVWVCLQWWSIVPAHHGLLTVATGGPRIGAASPLVATRVQSSKSESTFVYPRKLNSPRLAHFGKKSSITIIQT